MKFVHLHTHSHYSLLDGLIKIDALVERVKALEMPAIALTDHGNLYGAVEFYKKAKGAGIKPILGAELYVAPNDYREKRHKIDDGYYHLTVLCQNEIGWKNLIQLVTKSYLEGFYYKPRVDKNLLRQYSEGLIVLSGCLAGEIPQLILAKKNNEAEKVAVEYRDIFGRENFYLEIGYHPNSIKDFKEKNIDPNDELLKLSKKTGIELVATQDIHYLHPEDAEYHDILLAVQTGNKITDNNRLSLSEDDFSMLSPKEMTELFKDIPGAIENTIKIAERCNLELNLNKIHLPRFLVPANETANSYLRKLIDERIAQRLKEITPAIDERLNYELEIIEKTGFADYFLIVQDFINWAKNRGIVVGPGRGSAAGSLISYILGITNINPLEYNLLFERFLNPDRIQMPDIDIDFTDIRRDEVLGYLRETYGEDKVAQIITFGTMMARAAIRDVGRALGISYNFCDQLAKLIPFNQSLDDALKNVQELAELYKTNTDAKRIIDAARHLEGVARHVSIHACGVVIAEEPLTNYLPLQRAPQNENVIITQFEMHSIEDIGLLKMDLLGLKNLTTIEETIKLVHERTGEKIDINKIPLNDEKVFRLLQAGETVGVFQLESSGMRRYLKELKPTELEDVIAMVALYRPGPIELIPQYINRKHGREKIIYLHPKLKPILARTYGIGIYQEQMMQIARDLAGFSLAEADTLRKAIGKKIKQLLEQQKEKLIKGMLKNGIDEKTAFQIWELFPSFARYGFNRSHAACYALIGYQTAYLRVHYPVEFMASLLNADAGDVDRISFLTNEAKKININIFPPDINKSSVNFSPEGNDIRFGLMAVKNIGSNIVNALIEDRQKQGAFKNLADLLSRIQHKDLNKKTLESLIKCGAMDSIGIERGAALANIEEIIKFRSVVRKYQQNDQVSLFGGGHSSGGLRLKPAEPASTKDKLAWEKELLGIYISEHPLATYAPQIKSSKVRPIKDILATVAENGNQEVNIAGIVTKIKKIITKTGKQMLFAKIEDLNDNVEVVIFPDILSKNQMIWQENNILLVSGRLSWKDNEAKLICNNAKEL